MKKQTKSIAVLPFVNMSSDVENEYFSDGMTEEIINALAKIKSLKVTSRTSSFFFKNKNIPIPKIGEQLNVSIILEGSIRLSGDMMRITAQLIDVEEDFHFWSETFDRSMDNIFAVQDEISLLIADKLREHVGHFEIEDQLVEDLQVPAEVYKFYLKSRHLILKMTKPEIDKAILILEGIIHECPTFTLAYLAVHQGYALLGTIGLIPAHEAFAKGQPFLDKAIELDPDLPECQLNLAWISFLQKWDFASTYKHINKALEKRVLAEPYQTMASVLVAEGKFEAALSYITTALQLDPFSEINYHLQGFIFYGQKKYAQAAESFRKAIELKPDFVTSALYLGQTLLLMDKKEEALAFFHNLPDDDGDDLVKLGGTTLAYAALGDLEKTEVGIARLEAALKTPLMGRAMNFLILCQAILGRETATFDLIEQGIQFRLPMMVYLYKEPLLKPIQDKPRFKELMQEIFGDKEVKHLSKKKYKKPSLNTEVAEEYSIRLEECMSKEKPFLQASLTLRQLAEMISIHPNNLSELLNEKMGENFSAYINHYRVEWFKEIAKLPENSHLSLLGLAYECGFNSKTAFNTFFKKETGMTPKRYLKQSL
ncbi:MAG: helix-turn-helix domain-containing protein [Aureispira sp.]|nr:helix-turn-helix domain-containing protein [Aureispira sp.]